MKELTVQQASWIALVVMVIIGCVLETIKRMRGW